MSSKPQRGRGASRRGRRSMPSGHSRQTRRQAGMPRYSQGQKSILAVLLVLTTLMFVPSITTGIHQAQRISALENDNAATQKEIDDLQSKQDDLKDDAYIEREARKKFNYVKDGEEAYIVVSDNEQEQDTDQANKGRREQPWYVELIDSLKAVGIATEE